jgi:hypothetical protein
MNVKELKEALEELPDDMEIILQKDAEGNGYSPLYGADPDCIYIPETTWYGEVRSLHHTAEDHCLEEDEWAQMQKDYPRALVLHPVN